MVVSLAPDLTYAVSVVHPGSIDVVEADVD